MPTPAKSIHVGGKKDTKLVETTQYAPNDSNYSKSVCAIWEQVNDIWLKSETKFSGYQEMQLSGFVTT